MAEHLFKPLPDNLSEISDTDLETLVSEHVAVFKALGDNDPDTLGDRSAQEILEQTAAGKQSYAALKAAQAERAQAVEEYSTRLKAELADIPELEALAAETVETVEEPTDTIEEPAAETVEEPVTAAALRRPPLPAPGHHIPVVVSEPVDTRIVPLVASVAADDFRPGQVIQTALETDALLAAALNSTRGFEGRTVFARADWRNKIPGDRSLGGDNSAVNTGKIRAGVQFANAEMDALVAAGGQGNCAPLTPYYTLQNISTQERPVRDALVGYAADRGGITYMPPPALSTMASNGSVGVISEADQAQGGTFATKTCAVIVCSDIVSVQVDQIYKCLQFGNLQSRAYPEFVAQQNDLAISEWARFADTLLLDSIKAGSVNVTGHDVTTQSAVNNYLGDLFQAAAGIRSYNRMPLLAPLQGIAPGWLRDLLILDIVRGQFDRFERAQRDLDALLARFGVNMAWTLDGSSNGGQVFGAQSLGAVNEFPTTVETALFPPGTWLFLDAGTLDLGIVRDSVLNAINAYQLFAETFEQAAKVGVVSYWLTSTICANGAVAIPTASSGYC